MKQNRIAIQVAKTFYFASQRVQAQMITSLERKATPLAQSCLVAIAYVMA